MGIFDSLGGLLQQVVGGNAPPEQVHAAYDQVAEKVPQQTLADGLTHAFQSDQTPPFAQMLTGLFNQSSPEQKAGILNQLIASLGPNGVSQALNAVGAGGLTGVLAGGGTVSPQQAQQVTPAAVQTMAQHAESKDPSIVQKAASFYAQHPTLVKAIGAGALALLMSRISQARR